MKLYKYQYIEWKKSVCKITSLNKSYVKMRRFSMSGTKNGYSMQQWIKKKNLLNKMRTGEVKTIAPEKILQIILFYKNGDYLL